VTGGPAAQDDGRVNDADWRTTIDAGEFLTEAGPALRADPVENTVLLTIAHGAQDAGASPAHASTLLGWHAGGHHPVGAFVHTPGLPVVLGPLPESAAVTLAATLRHLGRALPGVNAAPAAAEAFAAEWQRITGPSGPSGSAATGRRLYQRQRLFRLAELAPPPPPPGRARVAAAADRDLLIRWTDAFHFEANGGSRPASASVVDSRLAYGGQLVWDTGAEPVAMAARTPIVGGMSRVAPVYTPPARRGQGYGGAVTAATSQDAQQAGAREVVLFTDLANPTSNALYQRLGYRPVSDRHILLFTSV
jgi:RimJ/RimL family protein N-acetyltransferase